MPETLKKLREPAALAAVVFAGAVVLVAIINLLAPPGNGAGAVSFSDRAYDQVTAFLSLDVAAAVAFAVYLANHAGPAVAQARRITLAALIEVGLAALFGVVSVLAQFGASGVDGESKLLRFLEAAGGAAVLAAAGLFTWLTWQALAPATTPAPGRAGGGAFVGGNWPSGPSGGGAGSGGSGGAASGGATAGQPYGQSAPPPGGFGWTPQQSAQQQTAVGQSSPTAFGQQVGQVPGQSAGYGQPSPQGAPGAPQPFGADRTQMLPPVQSGQQQPGQPQPGQPQPGTASSQSPFGQPPQPGQLGQSGYGQPPQPDQSPYGQPSQPDQSGYGQAQQADQSPYGQPPHPDQPAYGQPPQPDQSGYGQLGQQIGQATMAPGSGSHQIQPPLPPTMHGYAAEPSPWSPGGPGTGGAGAIADQPGIGQQQAPAQPGQQPPQGRAEDAEQRPGPFQIGDWRSE